MHPTDSISDSLARIAAGESLSESQTGEVFDALLEGRLSDAQILDFLRTLGTRGPTVDELVGAAKAMREHSTPVLPAIAVSAGTRPPPILDTCGTGGAPKLFNVSTIGAIVTAAAAGGAVLIAKHGNRSRTGRGSAELLEALGVDIHASPETQSRCLQEIGICFSFAPDHHPGAKHAANARKSLGTPTVFNLLGPLANPAGASRQLVGTYSEHNAGLLAAALARLGIDHAMVVTSQDGLDELTATAPNTVFTVQGGQADRSELHAGDLSIPTATIDQLRAETLYEAVGIARRVLSGTPGAAADMVVLNAAASLLVGGVVKDLQSGADLARRALGSGSAGRVLDAWVRLAGK